MIVVGKVLEKGLIVVESNLKEQVRLQKIGTNVTQLACVSPE